MDAAKPLTLPAMSHTPRACEKTLKAGVCFIITEEVEHVVVGIPVGTDTFVRAHGEKVVRDHAAVRLTHLLVALAGQQAVMLISTKSMAQTACFLQRGQDLDLSFFADGCRSDHVNLQPHQRMQVRPSTGSGGLGLASALKRQLAVSTGSFAGLLPKILGTCQG